MEEKEHNPLVTVYTGTTWQAEIIKGLLETNNIPAILQDESMTVAIMPDISGSVVVLVDEMDAPLAKRIIRENENKAESENDL